MCHSYFLTKTVLLESILNYNTYIHMSQGAQGGTEKHTKYTTEECLQTEHTCATNIQVNKYNRTSPLRAPASHKGHHLMTCNV